jgi:hypothetical protein
MPLRRVSRVTRAMSRALAHGLAKRSVFELPTCQLGPLAQRGGFISLVASVAASSPSLGRTFCASCQDIGAVHEKW